MAETHQETGAKDQEGLEKLFQCLHLIFIIIIVLVVVVVVEECGLFVSPTFIQFLSGAAEGAVHPPDGFLPPSVELTPGSWFLLLQTVIV